MYSATALSNTLFNAGISKLPSMPGFLSRIIVGTTRHKYPKASIQSLPNEILFEIFSFLELKPYILCHGVCKKWQQLLPSTDMHPIRRRLLDLYRRILDTPGFEKTLEWTNQNLQPFDREEYIRCLLTQYPAIPEEFRMWILEWPARLVIHCIWPGLTFIECNSSAPLVRRPGINWIAYRPFSPQLSSVVYKRQTRSEISIPGLFIWNHATEFELLIFEQDEPGLFGRVISMDVMYHSPEIIPEYPHHRNLEDDSDDDEDTDVDSAGEDFFATFADWIGYLEYFWDRIAEEIDHPIKAYFYADHQVLRPVPFALGSTGSGYLPAPRWNFRERAVDC